MTDPITPSQLDELDRLEQMIASEIPTRSYVEYRVQVKRYRLLLGHSARAMIDELRERASNDARESAAWRQLLCDQFTEDALHQWS